MVSVWMALLSGGCHLLLPLSEGGDLGAGADGPSPDQRRPVDQPRAEGPVDTGTDGAGPESWPAPCAPGLLEHDPYGSATMRICEDPAGTARLQCEAAALCNSAGWALCTKTEFLANGGTDHPTTVVAWIAACSLLSGTQYGPPQDGPCNCVYTPVNDLTAAFWDCAGDNMILATGNPLGLVTSSTCSRVGTNTPGNGAYWLARYSYLAADVNGAVCCHK